MLRTVDLVDDAGVPVLGVNVGQLGYLTEVEPDDLDDALERLRTGDYAVSDRMMLAVAVESTGPAGGPWWALNEAVVEKPHPGRLVRFDVVDQRRAVHVLRGRRRDRRDADRLDRVLVLGRRPDRVAAARVPADDAGVAAHAVRPLARARRQRGARAARDRPARAAHDRRARARRARAGRRWCGAGAARTRRGSSRSGRATSTRS